MSKVSKLSKLYKKLELLEETFSDIWELASDLGIQDNGLHNAYAGIESFESDFENWQNKEVGECQR